MLQRSMVTWTRNRSSGVVKVGMFFLYTVVIFAWVAATIFDDMEAAMCFECV